jgi:hypothetical protein
MGISHKIRSEVVKRLERVADGLPPTTKVKREAAAVWRNFENRGGNPAIAAPCEGCGRTNWFHVRRMHRRWEWRPYRPQIKTANEAPTMQQALKARDGMNKGILENLLDEFSVEKVDESK